MPKTARDVIEEIRSGDIEKLKRQLSDERRVVRAYREQVEKISADWEREFIRIHPVRKKSYGDFGIGIVICDTHGSKLHQPSFNALLSDLSVIGHLVKRVMWLGDILDCGGMFTRWQKQSTYEFADTYRRDVKGANTILNEVSALVPNAKHDYVYGNHEWWVERFAVNAFPTKDDAEYFIERMGPAAVLGLEERGFKWYKNFDFYDGLSVQGTIRRGKCFFTHGWSTAKHATYTHLIKAGNNIVHGDTHRMQSYSDSTVDHPNIGAYCPGCLCEKQPIFNHRNGPSGWSHGYGLQFFTNRGDFFHWNVPIIKGKSMVPGIILALKNGNVGK